LDDGRTFLDAAARIVRRHDTGRCAARRIMAVEPRKIRRYDLIVIAASAGGVEALREVPSRLPHGFPVPIVVVQHRTSASVLHEVLARQSALPVKLAEHAEKIRPGIVYLAPPDSHVVVHDGRFALRDGRKIRHVRSSANPLFSSAADTFANRVIGVVLTGVGRDATDGVQSIHAAGGIVIAQNQATSLFHGMAHSAIATGCVDRVLPIEQIAPALIELVAGDDPCESAIAEAVGASGDRRG